MIYDFEGHTPKIDPNSWVASNAVVIGKVELKKDSNIWFNVTLRGDVEPITVGEGSNVQDGSVIHTDPGCPAVIGKNVTIGHSDHTNDIYSSIAAVTLGAKIIEKHVYLENINNIISGSLKLQ